MNSTNNIIALAVSVVGGILSQIILNILSQNPALPIPGVINIEFLVFTAALFIYMIVDSRSVEDQLNTIIPGILGAFVVSYFLWIFLKWTYRGWEFSIGLNFIFLAIFTGLSGFGIWIWINAYLDE